MNATMKPNPIIENAASLKAMFDNVNATEDEKRKCHTYARLMGMDCFIFNREPRMIADALGAPRSALRDAFIKGIKHMIDEQPVHSHLEDHLLNFVYAELTPDS